MLLAPSSILYTMTNAVRWFDDHDELYWNVTGNDWPVPIDSASAIIVFPPGAAGNLRRRPSPVCTAPASTMPKCW